MAFALTSAPVRAALLVGAVLAVAVGLGADRTEAATTVVKVGRNASNQFADRYNPNSITIAAGDTVRWEWDGDRDHDVTSYTTGLFASPGGRGGMTGPSSVYSFTFNTPGTYTYYCQERSTRADADPGVIDANLNNSMVGKIVVLAADTTGPTAGSVAVTPNPTAGASSVTLTASISDSTTGNSNIAGAEYFIDTAGAAGTGTAMNPGDGTFNAPTESVTASFSVTGLSPGDHTLFVRGRDAAGNWGATASVVLGVTAAGGDTAGPTTSGLAANPNPTAGAASVTLTAIVSDVSSGNSNIAAAEYAVDVAGTPGSGTAMSAADGAFNSPTENVTASVPVSGISAGNHTLYVRGRDAAGNWGSTVSTTLSVTAPAATVWVGQNASGAADRAFNPASVTISAGGTVLWRWFAEAHDVQAYDGSYSSGAQGGMNGPSSAFSRVFAAPGTYTYYCSLHANAGDADPARIDERIAGGKMVGKIVVVSAPVTTNVNATPNPTTGSASVTLTATVTSSGSPAPNVTAAEYFIGTAGAGGAGTPMTASDGGFNSATEGVTATVNVTGLAVGTYTIYVHGRDANNSWGEFATVTLNVTSAAPGLNLTTAPVQFPPVSATGVEQTVTANPVTWEASDTTGTGNGWYVTISATNLTGPAGSIPVANFRIRLLATSITVVSGTGSPPTSEATTYVPLSTTTPLTILRATAGNGMGTYRFTPDFQLTIPASVAEGTYQSSMTVTIVSGP